MPILARDSDWLHLVKPPGVPVFPPHDDPDGDCVLARLLAVEPEQAYVARDLPQPERWAGGILHRLDHWTSGLLIAARHPDAFARGRAAFASHRLRKVYRFLTAARPEWSEHATSSPLAHDRKRKSRMVWQRGANTPHRGKWYPATTRFRRLKPGRWEAEMSTGVMHQVRVHAASVGLPLLGDRLYGGDPDPNGRYWLHHHTILGWPGGAPRVDVPGDWP